MATMGRATGPLGEPLALAIGGTLGELWDAFLCRDRALILDRSTMQRLEAPVAQDYGVPLILTSRADSVAARLASCAVAVLVARRRLVEPKILGG